jgi:hypothetical protein
VAVKLLSVSGVGQGCSLSPFLFAIGIHAEIRDALATVRAAAHAGELVGLVAILDNITLWGSPDSVTRLTAEVVSRISGRGDLSFKAAADEIIWLGPVDLPGPLQHLAAARNAKIVRFADCTRVLGTVVGGDAAATAAAARDPFHRDPLDS